MSPGLSSQESESEGSSSSTKSHEIVTEVGQKELFIDHLMNYFYQMFPFYRSYSPYSQAASDVTHDPGVNTGVKDTANLTSNSTSNIQSFAAARKRSRFDGNEEEDEDDMAGNGQAKKAKLTGLEFDTRRLACPYFKKDPIRFQTEQSCCGPGWVTVHRMKRHRLPISCLRCYAAFNTEAERDSHMRSLTQCEIKQPPPPIEGFNASQRAKLKTRPRDLKGMSEPGKWRRVYSILFPDTPGDEIPSPYYEFQNSKDLSWHVDPVMQYEQFLERELPLRVRQRLELRIEGALDPVQEALRGELVEIVHDVQLELYHDFTTSSRSDYVQSSSEIRSNDMCSGTQIQSCAIEPRREPVLSLDQDIQNVDTLNVPSDNPLAAWCPLPYVDWDSEDPELFSFGEITTLPTGTQDTDSAYGTMFSTGNVDQSIKMD
ncbi:hypothetical protein F5Y16DRAFT_138754 [Xylariaceae sp. FL0255]|nr:hypothetical protein F5Y16DRAFT_138754 [Xylariaceae sp. FL0255]